MGVPLINVLYQKGDPGTIGVLSTPLLLYHVEQLILGNIEVEILKKWVARGQKRDQQKVQDDDVPTTSNRDEESGIDSSATHTIPDSSNQPKL
jgi:sodium/bile acid cotransporter 7